MYTENSITLSSVPLENLPHLWAQNDVLIFLIDLDNYDASDTECLNDSERECLKKLKTTYFKKRYVVSRTVLKHVLCQLFNKSSILEISTYKDEFGEVHILNHKELYICISYTENVATLAISKVKVGIDIEIQRPLALKNTLKYLQPASPFPDKSERDADLLMAWTLKEAYCKFSNKPMLSILSKETDFNNTFYSSYLFDNKYIFSLITNSDSHAIKISRLGKISSD
ncbi:4'-phosphopantetheinyl transferase family protein [Methanosarcina sp. T3]|uniref:4'-phosphopantetheinyl transferase family protein n=1 Tax=Methanosarcina sp. T3 TaxID=3439062 RepID=UPI003F8342B7